MTTFTKIEKFETILDAEYEVQTAKSNVRMKVEGMLHCQTSLTWYTNKLVEAHQALNAALGELAPEEWGTYGEYRKASREFYAARVVIATEA